MHQKRENLLKARDAVEQLKFLPRLPDGQVAAIIGADQISYTLLRGTERERSSVEEMM